MTQLFLLLSQTAIGNVVTIVTLGLLAAITGYIIAWYYAKSVYSPVIKTLEKENTDLNSHIISLKAEYENLHANVNNLTRKTDSLRDGLSAINNESNDSSGEKVHVGKYVISKAKNGAFYFNLKATNGQTILTSGMFHTIAECLNAIDSARQYSSDDKWYDRKTSSDKKHYFILKSPDGHKTGKSEMYESTANMEKGIASVKRNAISTIVIE